MDSVSSVLFLKLSGIKLGVCVCLSVCLPACCLLLSGLSEPEDEFDACWRRSHHGHLGGAGASDYGWLEGLTRGEQIGDLGTGFGWGSPGPLRLCYCTVFHCVDVCNFMLPIMDVLSVFSSLKPCSNVTFTCANIFIGYIPRNGMQICDSAHFCQTVFHRYGSNLDPPQQRGRERVS